MPRVSLPWVSASRRKHVENPAYRVGEVFRVEDLVLVERGERDLGGSDQVEVVVAGRVDLRFVGGEEAGAVHGLLADEHRRDDRGEALAREELEREPHERELEPDARPGEVDESRAAGPGGAFDVEELERAAEVDVVLRLEGELRQGTTSFTWTLSSSSTPSGTDSWGRFGIRRSSRSSSSWSSWSLGSSSLSSVARAPAASILAWRSSFGTRPISLLAAFWSARRDSTLVLRAELGVELDHALERLDGPASGESGPEGVGVLADGLQVEHALQHRRSVGGFAWLAF